MKYSIIVNLIMMVIVVTLATEDQDLLIPPEPPLPNGSRAANQQCIIDTTYDLQDCFSYLTYQNMPYPPNSCCFVLQDLSTIEATGKRFSVCRCLRALVTDPYVIGGRAEAMAEGCSAIEVRIR
ncbi:hypothetical protein BVRB_9g205220 [Beta vulgaris subsp. vulgaris]|nr:hypothetical protein BVRB_9g205220 [Beta vulgaris subsp. vulgaris]